MLALAKAKLIATYSTTFHENEFPQSNFIPAISRSSRSSANNHPSVKHEIISVDIA